MKLTDSIIKAAKPEENDYSLADGHGLALLVKSSGAKWWRYRYRFNGTPKMLSIGVYPDVSLKEARNQHARLKELLAQGIDPSENRKEEKQQAAIAAANSFESVARLWWNHWKHDKTERHADQTIRRMEADIFPIIGHKPVNEITAAQFIAMVRKVESRGALDIAKRVLTLCGQVTRSAH
ncbi:MAG: integrase arm-type DNA-binding domain-containing protein [Nitrosomonas sp.]|nr:MAG: integrase arm-type DNA-binding domain-containing protein [Nitrosomonas sp.]